MKKGIQELLIQLIRHSLKDLDLGETDNISVTLDPPTDSRFGDLSTSLALKLSRQLHRDPVEIATVLLDNIKKSLDESGLKDYLQDVKIEGAGFINFYLNDAYFYQWLADFIREGEKSLRVNRGKGRRVLIEFVSANPTGPLSVAHARQAAVGDALANILDFLGFRVKKEYYLNDEGNQINILGSSIALRLKQLSGQKISFPEDHYQGEYIYDLARGIRKKNLKIKDFSRFGVKEILKTIKKELRDFGVKFDYWYSQKSLRKSGKIKKALDFLRQRGFLYEEGGAVWFRSTRFKDDKDRVVIKSDGAYTYLAPDIAYHQDKFKRGFSWLINLWGPDHHGYIARLKAAVSALGEEPESLSLIIVQLATLFRNGNPIQMSTRRGEYITLREVLDEVGRDAARFFFLMRRTSSHLDFDLSLAKKQTPENPVYYVQYAYARISSILRKATLKPKTGRADLTLLKEKEEIILIKKLSQYSWLLNVCFQTRDPYLVTVYLQELAEAFHKFYDLHRVLGQDNKITQSRLILLETTKRIIGLGLGLLGISRPERM